MINISRTTWTFLKGGYTYICVCVCVLVGEKKGREDEIYIVVEKRVKKGGKLLHPSKEFQEREIRILSSTGRYIGRVSEKNRDGASSYVPRI